MNVLSVNAGRASSLSSGKVTGIDKRPVTGRVLLESEGVDGDAVCDRRHHGGREQAVYAYAREDLDAWEVELHRPLSNGSFGENLTTSGVDVTGALIGERWRIGECVLQVTAPRFPCRTFSAWMGDQEWGRRFAERGKVGAYLSVVVPGWVQAGDVLSISERPDHDVSIGMAFRALTTNKSDLPRLVKVAHFMPAAYRDRVLK